MEAAVLLLVAGLLIGLALARWRRRRLVARSRREGRAGADAAWRILDRAGYRVLATEVSRKGIFLVDGEAKEFTVRADAVAARWFRRYVVEVKGGREAASLDNRDTRRQLLEYALVFRSRGVLLVDVPAGKIRRVEFPG
ncbi:MAG: hypothetical protein MUE73_16590 [Planctomycetes bacterium]|jgi:hypothetical protein|nr:hypothetical protein [Planctomycetota bacterium]